MYASVLLRRGTRAIDLPNRVRNNTLVAQPQKSNHGRFNHLSTRPAMRAWFQRNVRRASLQLELRCNKDICCCNRRQSCLAEPEYIALLLIWRKTARCEMDEALQHC